MTPGFELGLSQQLRQEFHLTQQLILQMQLLQLSALDLEQLVRKELQENPALEESDGSEPSPDLGAAAPMPESVPSEADSQRQDEGQVPEPHETQIEVRPGEEYSINELMPDDGWQPMVSHGSGTDDDSVSAVELAAGPSVSLAETLMPHLRSVLCAEDARVAEFIIESLDEDGFLTLTPQEVAENQCVEPGRVEEILHVIQRMDPGGIACRDRRESFLVQLELAGMDPATLVWKVVSDHWGLLMKKQTAKIARLCGATEDEVRDAVHRLLTLETRPARSFAPGAPDYVLPDFSIEWQDDSLAAVPNDERVPRLRLSQRYVEVLRDPRQYTKEQVKFAREKYQRALMFLRGIESRRRTIKQLVELIMKEQHEFFQLGKQFLKPATLREAANIIGVHPSTVSRAIAGKYLECDHGIFPFGYFFKSGAGDKSRTSIKQKVQAIIEGENKSGPLSDDEICSRLKQEGIDISRRTVAKYRGELHIPGASERRQF